MPGPLFINLDDIDGEVTTPLALACDKGSPDEVRSYLAMGYDPNEWPSAGPPVAANATSRLRSDETHRPSHSP